MKKELNINIYIKNPPDHFHRYDFTLGTLEGKIVSFARCPSLAQPAPLRLAGWHIVRYKSARNHYKTMAA